MKILSKGEYYGAMKLEHQFNGIVLSEYDYFTQKTDWHFHENPYLMYVLQGNLYDINKKRTTICSTGSLMLHNWQEAHFNEKHSVGARGFHIEFEPDWFAEKKLNINFWEGSLLIENPNLHHITAKIYFEFKCQDAYSNCSIELLLFQLCESIEATNEIQQLDEPLWMNQLRQLLHENHEDLSLNYLSKTLGVHPGHISRAVPKYLKTTLGDYIRRIKIKKALNEIVNPKNSLLDISYSCGFSDQSHFNRIFKLYMGMTPMQYRSKIAAC